MRLANMLVSIFSAVFMGVCSVPVFYLGVGASLVTIFIAAFDNSLTGLFAGSLMTVLTAVLVIGLSVAVLVLSIINYCRSKNISTRKYATGCGVVCGLTLLQVISALILFFIYLPILSGELLLVVLWPGIGALFLVAMILLTIFASKKIQEDRDFEDLLYSMQNRSEY